MIRRHVSARVVALLNVSSHLNAVGKWHDLANSLLLHVGLTQRPRRQLTETSQLAARVDSRDSRILLDFRLAEKDGVTILSLKPAVNIKGL